MKTRRATFDLLEGGDRTAVDVIFGIADERTARTAKDIDVSRAAARIVIGTRATGCLNVIGEQLVLRLCPSADLLNDQAVVTKRVLFFLRRHLWHVSLWH